MDKNSSKTQQFYQNVAELYAVAEKESQTYDTISLEWFMTEKSTQAMNTIIRRMGVNEDKRENDQNENTRSPQR